METTQAKHYQPAAWRCATPYHADTDRMGVCFDLPDGQVIRLAISRESAVCLAGAISDYLPGIGCEECGGGGVSGLLDRSRGGDAGLYGARHHEHKLTIQALSEDSIAEFFRLHSDDLVLRIRKAMAGRDVKPAQENVVQGTNSVENGDSDSLVQVGFCGDGAHAALDVGPGADGGAGEVDDINHARSHVVLQADTTDLAALIDQLKLDLADAPLQVRELALNLLDGASELVCLEQGPASGARVTVLLKPSQRLLDFASAVRARNFNFLGVEESHLDAPV